MKKNLLFCFVLILAIFAGFLSIRKVVPTHAETKSVSVVALGDSIAYGETKQSGVQKISSYADLLLEDFESVYGEKVEVTNLAHSGDVLSDMMTVVSNNQSVVQNADVITICIGSNEILGPATNVFDATDILSMYSRLSSLASNMKQGTDLFHSNFKSSLQEIINLNPNAQIYAMTSYNPYYFTSASASLGYINFTLKLGEIVDYYQDGDGLTSAPTGTGLSGIPNNVIGLNTTIRNAISEINNPKVHLVDVKEYFVNMISSGSLTSGTYSSYIDCETGDYVITVNNIEYLQYNLDPHPTEAGQTLINTIHWNTISDKLYSVSKLDLLSGGSVVDEVINSVSEDGSYPAVSLTPSITYGANSLQEMPKLTWEIIDTQRFFPTASSGEKTNYSYTLSNNTLTITPKTDCTITVEAKVYSNPTNTTSVSSTATIEATTPTPELTIDEIKEKIYLLDSSSNPIAKASNGAYTVNMNESFSVGIEGNSKEFNWSIVNSKNDTLTSAEFDEVVMSFLTNPVAVASLYPFGTGEFSICISEDEQTYYSVAKINVVNNNNQVFEDGIGLIENLQINLNGNPVSGANNSYNLKTNSAYVISTSVNGATPLTTYGWHVVDSNYDLLNLDNVTPICSQNGDITNNFNFTPTQTGTYGLYIACSNKSLVRVATLVVENETVTPPESNEPDINNLKSNFVVKYGNQNLTPVNGEFVVNVGNTYTLTINNSSSTQMWYVINSITDTLPSSNASDAIASSGSFALSYNFVATSTNLGVYGVYLHIGENLYLVGKINVQTAVVPPSTITAVDLDVLWAESALQGTKVVSPTGDKTYEFVYNQSDIFFLKIKTSVSVADMIQFFYYKDGSNKYVEIPNENNDREIEITSILKSVGEYKFFAKVNGNLVEADKIITIKILRAQNTGLSIKLTAEEVFGNSGEMNQYRLIVENTNPASGYNLDELSILWYVIDGDQEHLIRSGNHSLYTPDIEGRYTVRVDILQNGVSVLSVESASNATVEFMARRNNSANIFIYVGIVVGVLSLGLVISIVVKIKNEKVW